MPDPIDRLYEAVLRARSADPAQSRTAKLLREGVPKMAKKLVEEATEVAIEGVSGDRRHVIEESVDLVYNLTVLWAELGIVPGEVWAEMDRRERTLGLAEKLPKLKG